MKLTIESVIQMFGSAVTEPIRLHVTAKRLTYLALINEATGEKERRDVAVLRLYKGSG